LEDELLVCSGDRRAVNDDQVFVVLPFGGVGPVEAAGAGSRAVEDGDFC
jgi:hypothetical protein